jgi:beta-xylosidase
VVGLCVGASVMVGCAATTASASTGADPLEPATLLDPGVVITPGSDVPDPFIMTVAGLYFMFASQEQFFGANVPVMVSTSLERWAPSDLDAMPKLPPWAAPGFTWSPDVRRIDGRYVMWFNAAVAGQGFGRVKCIGVATATSVIGPYVSHATAPAVCQLGDLGSIDPRTFLDPEGRLWLLWKSDDNADVAGSAHSKIFIQRLARSGLRLLGRPRELMTADLAWEGRIVEAPDMVFAAGRYWLFFSGNWFNQPAYAIGVASCSGPTGPCAPATLGPWFASNAEGLGPGEESLFYDGSRWWMLYAPAAVNYEDPTPRPAAMARLVFDPSGPAVLVPGTPAWDRVVSLPRPVESSLCTQNPFEATCGPPGGR